MMMKPIGILGGTFDPIHLGHLRIATELLQQLPLQEIRIIPCQIPVHKAAPHATAAHRLLMLKIAITHHTQLVIDDRELQRKTPSYMIDTLLSLRKELPDTPLCLILGMDAFEKFCQWRSWKKIISLAHLIVVPRPGFLSLAPEELLTFIKPRIVEASHPLTEKLGGYVLFQPVNTLDIASSDIRQKIATGHDVHHLLPQAVWKYIQKNSIYA